jgi:signal transduction histidine kinase
MRGTDTAPEPLHTRRFAELNQRLVRLVAIAATGAMVLLGISGAVLKEADFLIQAVAAGVVAGVAWIQVVINRQDAGILLSITTAVIIMTTTIVGTSSRAGASSTALAIIGMVGSLFIGKGIRFYVAGYATLLVAANFAWYDEVGAATVGALIASTAFTFGVLVFAWLRSQLQDEAARFRHLFANAPVSIWEEDFTEVGDWLEELRAQGVDDLIDYLDEHPEALAHAFSLIEIQAVNDAAVELLEADDQSDLVGRLHPETLTPQALESMIPQLMAVWSSIDHLVLQVRDGRTLRGSRIEGLLSWTAPVTADGLDLSRVIVAIVDVTGIRSAAEDLELLVKSRDELVATVSHELRTPLTTVVGLSHELRDAFNTFASEEVVDLVGLIAQQSSEVATIVEDLLVAARTRGGSLGVSAAPVDLAYEVEATLKAIGLNPEKMLTRPQYLPAVNGDSGRIRQILRNLITNAQRYGGSDMRVVVRAGDTVAAVEVRDSGPPLSTDESEEIFSRYYRTRQTPGVTASVGLGLTVSQELARLMGGDITYHHDGEAVFTVRLPVVERVPASTPRAESPEPRTENREPVSADSRLSTLDSRS